MQLNVTPRSIPRQCLDVFQAGLAYVGFTLMRLMPIGVASATGGFVARMIGPLLPVSKSARRNLSLAFPTKTPQEIEKILRGSWDNFGRVAFEFPLLHRLTFGGPDAHVHVLGYEHVDDLQNDGKPGLFLSGHFANWELASRSIIMRGLPLHLIYRLPNNPWTVKLLMHRNPGEGEMVPKGIRGARRSLQLLSAGGHLGIMADQKMNEGIAVPFFGRDAMTAPALAQFALKYKCPVVPVQVERLGGVKFRVTNHPPIYVEDTGDRHHDIDVFMRRINTMLEDWVRQNPDQWLWLHKRWPEN